MTNNEKRLQESIAQFESGDVVEVEFVDFTLQTPERGYFNPSQEMLDLTDKFIQAVNIAIGEKELLLAKRGDQTTLIIMVDTDIGEVYTLHNNGIEASYKFHGLHNINNLGGLV